MLKTTPGGYNSTLTTELLKTCPQIQNHPYYDKLSVFSELMLKSYNSSSMLTVRYQKGNGPIIKLVFQENSKRINCVFVRNGASAIDDSKMNSHKINQILCKLKQRQLPKKYYEKEKVPGERLKSYCLRS